MLDNVQRAKIHRTSKWSHFNWRFVIYPPTLIYLPAFKTVKFFSCSSLYRLIGLCLRANENVILLRMKALSFSVGNCEWIWKEPVKFIW